MIHNLLRYHVFMKKCPICGRKVVSKRKDAIYCRNPRCRKKAFLARKEQAASAPPPIGPNKASVVLSFSDGSRWLMELTPLQTIDNGQLPTLTHRSVTVWSRMASAVTDSGTVQANTSLAMAQKPRLFFLSTPRSRGRGGRGGRSPGAAAPRGLSAGPRSLVPDEA